MELNWIGMALDIRADFEIASIRGDGDELEVVCHFANQLGQSAFGAGHALVVPNLLRNVEELRKAWVRGWKDGRRLELEDDSN